MYKRPRISRRSLRRVKRKLFTPNHVVGDSYLPSKYSQQGKKKGNRTFNQKVSKSLYPPFTYQKIQVEGIDHNSAGTQYVDTLTLVATSDITSLMTKLTDIYRTSGGVESAAIPNGSGGLNLSYNRGLRIRLKEFLHKFDFCNTSSASMDFEMIFVKPARLIASTDTTHGTASTWWQTCNDRCGLAANGENPIAPMSNMSQYLVGDRPYKGATKAMFGKWWTIVKTHKFALQPGQLIKVTHKQIIDGLVDYEDLEAYRCIPSQSLQVIVIGKGQVVNGSGVGLGFTDVTYSNFQLSFTYNRWMTAQLENYLRPVKMLTYSGLTDIAEANQTFYNPDSRTTVGYTENA